jgi:putative ABC transport system ATP-binding protein
LDQVRSAALAANADEFIMQLPDGYDTGLGERGVRLSGGQRQRVAIARALANDPPVLLADEPTGNLDEKTGEEVMEIFRELRSEGRSIIMVTHNPEYEREVDRIVAIHDGRITRS